MITYVNTNAGSVSYSQSFATAGEFNQGAAGCFASEGGIPMGAPSRPGPTLTGLGGVSRRLRIMDAMNNDGTVIDATGAAGAFHRVNTPGTSSLLVSATATSNTKTPICDFEWIVPDFYIQAGGITATINAKYTSSVSVSTKTILIDAYLMADDGTMGATIGTTSATTITTSMAPYPFAITGTSLTPGARILFRVTGVITETGGGNATITIVPPVLT